MGGGISVYVDVLMNHGWSLGPSCHMYADTLDELHEIAAKIGMKRSWFQDKRLKHYDLVASKRRLAVAHGAIEHTSREAVDFWTKTLGWKI